MWDTGVSAKKGLLSRPKRRPCLSSHPPSLFQRYPCWPMLGWNRRTCSRFIREYPREKAHLPLDLAKSLGLDWWRLSVWKELTCACWM